VVPSASLFAKLFQQAFALARKHFYREVEDIGSNSFWGTIGDHVTVKDKIPLPLSNTEVARQMRTAVFLVILSSALSDYVFQPSYALDVDESPDFLHKIAAKDPPLGTHLRSVLLRAQSETERTSEAERRTEMALQAVMDCLDGMLSEEDEGPLRNELGRICKGASALWQGIQALDQTIVAVMELEDIPDQRDWKILDFGGRAAKDATTTTSSGSRDQQSGDTLAARGGGGGGGEGKGKATAGPAPVAERVIWPSLVIGGSPDRIVMAGYALSDGQIRAARTEKTMSPHRDNRSRRRTGSMEKHGGGPKFGLSLRHRSGRA
jgi:hypothetical protein